MTARVRMLKTSAGPLGNRAVGQVVEVSDDEALALLEDRAAVLLDPPVKAIVESAMLAGGENATLPPASPRRRR